ncbi:DUF3147 family protein, partial [Staphylococcus aureus]|uniref:DUF3147 family protein n=1 Tax=Staphylococcus aureus TaxID=1280 RepID=UPI0021B39824
MLHFLIAPIPLPLPSIIPHKLPPNLPAIIPTIPPLFLPAIIPLPLHHRRTQLLHISINLSTRPILPILSSILTLFFTSLYINHKRYPKRPIFTLLSSFLISLPIFTITHLYFPKSLIITSIHLLTNKLFHPQHHQININQIFSPRISS